MGIHEIRIEQSFEVPCDVLFDRISEPERMSGWTTGMTLRRCQDSIEPGNPNGVGSRRLVTMLGVVRFEETILAYERPRVFEYSITRGSPVKNQRGRQRITPTSEGCNLSWHITFEPRIPYTGPLVGLIVKSHFVFALRGLARQLRQAHASPSRAS